MIERHASMKGFFHEAVTRALKNQRVEATEMTAFYLVNLLEEFGHSSQAEERLARSLTLMLADAVEVPSGTERFQRFRELGDTALYVTGFFRDYLARRGVDRSYVVTVGGRAYGSAAALCRIVRVQSVEYSDVYEELANKFDLIGDVLSEVGDTASLRTNRDVLRLYDRWLRTRAPHLARELAREGLFPQGPSGDGDN
ncbi:MAG: hypothetical protein IT379_06085 [Deltaproteobacteria bacterium]|nr:hypothetical protein [Deltaproteobacteria bacterium]